MGRKYAILFSSGFSSDSVSDVMYEELRNMYNLLVRIGYSKANIYAYYHHGLHNRFLTDEGGNVQNLNADLNGDNQPDIRGAATWSNFESVLEELKDKKLGSLDQVFIYFMLHAQGNPGSPGNPTVMFFPIIAHLSLNHPEVSQNVKEAILRLKANVPTTDPRHISSLFNMRQYYRSGLANRTAVQNAISSQLPAPVSKIIIASCCYAGGFQEVANLDNATVITPCGELSPLHEPYFPVNFRRILAQPVTDLNLDNKNGICAEELYTITKVAIHSRRDLLSISSIFKLKTMLGNQYYSVYPSPFARYLSGLPNFDNLFKDVKDTNKTIQYPIPDQEVEKEIERIMGNTHRKEFIKNLLENYVMRFFLTGQRMTVPFYVKETGDPENAGELFFIGFKKLIHRVNNYLKNHDVANFEKDFNFMDQNLPLSNTRWNQYRSWDKLGVSIEFLGILYGLDVLSKVESIGALSDTQKTSIKSSLAVERKGM